uniref:(California timema) hypothetical protein n=1 Tax=Timema californicum TaxID=61474 RepID=A0A7R9JB56_TIMCA|nr:unnamed protein product [Timema californicum]
MRKTIPDHQVPASVFVPYIPGNDQEAGKQSSLVTIAGDSGEFGLGHAAHPAGCGTKSRLQFRPFALITDVGSLLRGLKTSPLVAAVANPDLVVAMATIVLYSSQQGSTWVSLAIQKLGVGGGGTYAPVELLGVRVPLSPAKDAHGAVVVNNET